MEEECNADEQVVGKGRSWCDGFRVLDGGRSWAATAHSDLVGCDGCHVPHNAGTLPGVPLWNGSRDQRHVHDVLQQDDAGDDGRSAQRGVDACASVVMTGQIRTSCGCRTARSSEPATLTSSHPISFVYDSALAAADGALKNPSQPSTLGRTIAQDLLDVEQQDAVQQLP